MSEDPETNLANTGIEYGGWGLLLLYAIKRCFVIARTNGIHIEFGSPCAMRFMLDTNPHHSQPPGDIEMAQPENDDGDVLEDLFSEGDSEESG